MMTKPGLPRLVVSLFLALAACAEHVPVVDELSSPPLPESSYVAAAQAGSTVYRILPQESLILIRVGRAGAMKGLGHEHAIASEDVEGLVEIGADSSSWRADLAVPLRNLIVDRLDYRHRLELDTDLSEADVAGTYTNMLKVLEPSLYPWVMVHARIASMDAGQPMLNASITLHGTTIEYLLPVALEIDATRLVVSGHAIIRHSEFGLTPFAAAGGLLRVADELEVEFQLVGQAVMP
jgi:hypothetical protein